MNTELKPNSALWETIHRQPEDIHAVLETQERSASASAGLLVDAERVFLLGTGTSGHAAIVGEHLLRSAGAQAYATTNFDFVTYPRPLTALDAVIAISHRGSKTYGRMALARAVESKTRLIAIAGEGAPVEGPEVIIRTVPQEASSCHTASYTTAMTAVAMIAVELGSRTRVNVKALEEAVARVPGIVETMLERQGEIMPVAQALAQSRRLVLIGAGPNFATAREGALKVKESCFITAEGFELETVLHGGLQAIEAGDVAVVIAAEGPAADRTLEAIRALHEIAARVVIIADERVVSRLHADSGATVIEFPAVPEVLSPIPAVIPLQLLAAYTSALLGTDADNFRRESEGHRKAGEQYQL